jgi:glyoxylase-like metal-dependent hydrolase (beta-lactamase superfamily II)
MIKVETLIYNPFQVNTYLVWDDTLECVVVDPAFYSAEESDSFNRIVSGEGLVLTGQVYTHCHVDHVLGAGYITDRYDLPLRAHENETGSLNSAPRMGEVFGLKLDPIEGIGAFIRENELVPVGNHFLKALFVPGHSPGSLAFYSEEGGFVLTGDALFRGSIGRTDLPGGNYDQLIESIHSRLLHLPPGTIVYPGHGPSSTIAIEKSGNPFLG